MLLFLPVYVVPVPGNVELWTRIWNVWHSVTYQIPINLFLKPSIQLMISMMDDYFSRKQWKPMVNIPSCPFARFVWTNCGSLEINHRDTPWQITYGLGTYHGNSKFSPSLNNCYSLISTLAFLFSNCSRNDRGVSAKHLVCRMLCEGMSALTTCLWMALQRWYKGNSC